MITQNCFTFIKSYPKWRENKSCEHLFDHVIHGTHAAHFCRWSQALCHQSLKNRRESSCCGYGCVILWVWVWKLVGVFFVNLYCHETVQVYKKNTKKLLCTASGSDDHQPFRQVHFKWACLIFQQNNWPITACLIFQQKNWPITACMMS